MDDGFNRIKMKKLITSRGHCEYVGSSELLRLSFVIILIFVSIEMNRRKCRKNVYKKNIITAKTINDKSLSCKNNTFDVSFGT